LRRKKKEKLMPKKEGDGISKTKGRYIGGLPLSITPSFV
jgi:hypothetical protein